MTNIFHRIGDWWDDGWGVFWGSIILGISGMAVSFTLTGAWSWILFIAGFMTASWLLIDLFDDWLYDRLWERSRAESE